MLRERVRDPRRRRAALRRDGHARAGSRRRARPAGPAQDRAGDLDRRDLADHRGRARRHRFRPDARPPVRARPRPDAAGDRARAAAPTPISGAAAPGASSPASATGCGRRRRTAASRPIAPPEILAADLSGLALDLALWGVADPAAPRLSRSAAARRPSARRARCCSGSARSTAMARVTDEGRAIARLALPPRLARMLVDAAREGEAALAAEIATLLTERGLGGAAVDLGDRLAAFRRDRSPRAEDARRLAAHAGAGGARRRARRSAPRPRRRPLLARAFPDRIARARGKRGEFLMANGRAAAVEPHDALAARDLSRHRRSRRPRRRRAHPARRAADAGARSRRSAAPIETTDELSFDRAAAALRTRRRRRFGALTLAEQTLPAPADEAAALALGARRAERSGSSGCRGPRRCRQWRDRVAFLRRSRARRLARSLRRRARRLARLARALSRSARPRSPRSAPTTSPSPSRRRSTTRSCSGSTARRRPISPRRPATPSPSTTRPRAARRSRCACRSSSASPSIPRSPAAAFALTLNLLSPAHRPIQITRDLPGFWRGSWAAVRADLRGRYPRHLWPEDPAAGAADRAGEAEGNVTHSPSVCAKRSVQDAARVGTGE